MAAKKEVKPPKKLRITLKEQIENEYDADWKIIGKLELPPLGFAQEYNPDTKTFEKRKHTQDDWAYGGGYGVKPTGYFEVDGKMWERRSRWQLKAGVPEGSRYCGDNTELITTENIVPEHLQPFVIDNVPLEGFRIQKSVARGGRYNNKLWRVLDPRGFELEISTECFAEIVLNGIVNEGVIDGFCIWKTPKMLVRV